MTERAASWLRLLPPILMLVVTGAFLYSRSRPEQLPPYQPLTAFPLRIGVWQGIDDPILEDVRKSLGEGEFLQRHYSRSESESSVDLFLAFFPTQRAGATIHSPQHCLPGAGWSPVEHGFMQLPRPGGGTLGVNRYIVAHASNRDLVLYWYQSHGRVIASEYWGKFYLVADAIRLNRSDGGLVRVATPLGINEGIPEALQRTVAFAEAIIPQLSAYIPN
jgi:EpsI family protein